jgi:hypothetical protein
MVVIAGMLARTAHADKVQSVGGSSIEGQLSS